MQRAALRGETEMVLQKYLPELVGVLLFIMMGTQIVEIGPILILAEIALLGALFLFRTSAFLEVTLRWWPLLITPILAILSALWSEATMATARYAAQFFFTAYAGVVLARLLTPKRFICVLLVALFAFSILCIVYGRQGISERGYVLIGLTGSKNQLGYAAQVLLLSGLAVLAMREIASPLRWLAVLSLPLATWLLVETFSATALVMAVGGSAALFALLFMQRLPPGGRLASIIGGLVILAPLAAVMPEIVAGVNHFIFDVLDKSPTLTGRTRLWAAADDLISRRPFLGYGYQAIWMGDSTDSTWLHRMTHQTDGRQFHFHHQFRQIAVDTGLIGLAAYVAVLIAAAFAALRQLLLRPDVATSFFLIMFALLVARGFADVVLGPFSIHTLLFYAAATYAFWRPQQAPAPEPAFSPRPLRRAPA